MTIDSSRKAYEIIRRDFRYDIEEVWVVALTVDLRVIHKELIFRGTLNACLVHPREIFRLLLKYNAYTYILAHNHPSGDTRPSKEDLNFTRRLFRAGEIMQIQISDHLITSPAGYLSLADSGFMKKLVRNKPARLPHR